MQKSANAKVQQKLPSRRLLIGLHSKTENERARGEWLPTTRPGARSFSEKFSVQRVQPSWTHKSSPRRAPGNDGYGVVADVVMMVMMDMV